MSRNWAKGSTAQWRKIRAFVLARDGYKCRTHADGWCDAVPGRHDCAQWATQVHHVKGREITGDDPRWLAASCRPCNLHIGPPGRHTPEPRRVQRW